MATCSTVAGVPRPRPALGCRRWGVNVHFTDAPDATMQAIAAGFSIVRMDLWWGWVENAVGAFNFSRYDRWMELLQKHQLHPYMVLHGKNPAVNPAAPGCPYGCSPATPQMRARWAEFAVAAMRRYRSRGIVWELMNEPNQVSGAWAPSPNASDYAKLALVVAAAKNTPGSGVEDEVLVGPALAGTQCWTEGVGSHARVRCPSYDWFRNMSSAGALSAFDAVSLHGYVVGAPEQHEQANSGRFVRTWGGWGSFRAMLRAANHSGMPLLSGEWGWSTCSGTDGRLARCRQGASPDANTPADQAVYLSRQWLLNTRQNLSISIWYDWQDDGTNTTYGEDNFGVRGADGRTAKPAYAAATTLQLHFSRRNYLGDLRTTGSASPFGYAMAFGEELPPAPVASGWSPPLPSALAQGLAAEPTGALAVWSIARPESCAAPRLVGLGHNTSCAGTIWEGCAAAMEGRSCESICRATLGCQSYTIWPAAGDDAPPYQKQGVQTSLANPPLELFCRTHHSRCAVPEYSRTCGDFHTCGENATTFARSYTLPQAACKLSLDVQLPTGSRAGCFRLVSHVGADLGRTMRPNAAGILHIEDVSEQPLFLLGTTCT